MWQTDHIKQSYFTDIFQLSFGIDFKTQALAQQTKLAKVPVQVKATFY